ncbi:transposase [Microbulbifer halophilus]|uniref:transposase n=1 Tax=Microbulbifer halophilus TaxID=453963 RepID=UPI00224437A6|nr:transposase [Microbulbifer halophilus]MCW8128665.1 transposase [Microbulbifer halophilus]
MLLILAETKSGDTTAACPPFRLIELHLRVESRPDNWSSEEKFCIVLETAPMTEAELSEYCRKHGLYPEQIEAWKVACMSANAESDEQSKRSQKTSKAEKKRIKKLETELRRKEKALAETAALLTLSKKAEAIWGHNDEDE